MAYGGNAHQSNPEKQRQYLEEIARHQEVHPEMLLGVIGVEQTVAFDAYQTQAEVADLLAQPLPLNYSANDEDGKKTAIADSILNNTALYDDEVEDLIQADPVIEKLLALHGTEERARAMRARRTVVALILRLPPESTGDSDETGARDEGAA